MEELQIEYFVDLADAVPALEATWSVAKKWGHVVDEDDEVGNWLTGPESGYLEAGSLMNYCHLRVIRADDQLLSPTTTNEGHDTLAIAFGLNRVLWGEDGAGDQAPLTKFACVRTHLIRIV